MPIYKVTDMVFTPYIFGINSYINIDNRNDIVRLKCIIEIGLGIIMIWQCWLIYMKTNWGFTLWTYLTNTLLNWFNLLRYIWRCQTSISDCSNGRNSRFWCYKLCKHLLNTFLNEFCLLLLLEGGVKAEGNYVLV